MLKLLLLVLVVREQRCGSMQDSVQMGSKESASKLSVCHSASVHFALVTKHVRRPVANNSISSPLSRRVSRPYIYEDSSKNYPASI